MDLFFAYGGTFDKLHIRSSHYHANIHDPCTHHNYNIHSNADVDKYTNSCTYGRIRPIDDRDQ
jgi:hypothetical protein